MVRPRIFFYNLHCYDKHNRCPLSTIAAQFYPFRPWAMVSVRSVMLAVLTWLCSITWVWTVVSGQWSPPTRLEHKNLDNDCPTHVITELHTEPNSALHYSEGSVFKLK